MFDIGFLELIIVSVVGLLVLGPDRLPGAIRTVSLYVGKMRRSFNGIRAEIERELRADEIRQELHNQSIMQDLRDAQKGLQETTDAVRQGLGHNPDLKLGKDGYPEDKPFEDLPTADSDLAATEATADSAPEDIADTADADEPTPAADDSPPEDGDEPSPEPDNHRP